MAEDVKVDEQALRVLLEGDDNGVTKELVKRAIKIERRAARRCPVDTGRLRSSITFQLGHDAKGHYVDIGSNVNYALYVELGTSKQAAQPYLRPALLEVDGA